MRYVRKYLAFGSGGGRWGRKMAVLKCCGNHIIKVFHNNLKTSYRNASQLGTSICDSPYGSHFCRDPITCHIHSHYLNFIALYRRATNLLWRFIVHACLNVSKMDRKGFQIVDLCKKDLHHNRHHRAQMHFHCHTSIVADPSIVVGTY